MHIEPGGLDHPAVIALLEEHLRDMHANSPPESVHALDLSGLRRPDVTFWSAWDDDGTLLACGALKELDGRHGEIKSMRTPMQARRRGAGRTMLEHLITTAKQRGYTRLSLETGTMAAFVPARTLYASRGFVPCGAFADYPADDPNSCFMTLAL
jgi:putative acetyltransferase